MRRSSVLLTPLTTDSLRLFSTQNFIKPSPKESLTNLKKILSWKNTVKIFNSLKKVDIKFTRLGAGNKEKDQKYSNLEIPPSQTFEPLFFVMPPVIRKEFEKFNEMDTIEDNLSVKGDIPTDETIVLHQFLPEASFMSQVMSFRNSMNLSQQKKPNRQGILGSLKQIFIKKPETTNPKIDDKLGRKISLLGFHGWFPNKLLQRVIGDPRRTSSRMVDMLQSALADAEPFPPFCEGPAAIYKFPLQSEGTIEERVEKHFEELQKIPKNYSHEELTAMDHLKESDTIILGAHSQGAPVAVILLAKLIESGIINVEKQKVTILTVAGIFHGPFPPLRKNLVVQYVEADAARQLFDLNNPDSKVSQLLADSLNKVLQSGINMTCVASWLDQVVPFYSACLLGFEHPNIWRSVHINADHYRPDFLTKLVETGLKIKNTLPGLGEPETHMILSEVSDYISGSIYQHSTHSSAYRKLDSYRTVIEWMKSGPSTRNIPISPVDHVRHRPLQSTINPYYLPWLFRGWLNSPEILNNPLIGRDISELRKMYENWKPESKALKELKFKLEPMSSSAPSKL